MLLYSFAKVLSLSYANISEKIPSTRHQQAQDTFVGFCLSTIKNLLLLVELIIEKRTLNLNKLKDAIPRLLENNLPETASNSFF